MAVPSSPYVYVWLVQKLPFRLEIYTNPANLCVVGTPKHESFHETDKSENNQVLPTDVKVIY